MKYLFFCFLLITETCFAQRQYAVCDSTSYYYNVDTSIIASRHKLYWNSNTGLQLINDFTVSNPDYYIRDFDIINTTLWYTLVGSKYIGSPTLLYRTNNKGLSWTIDTSYYEAAKSFPASTFSFYSSINSVQKIGIDSIILFVGYYESGLVYSTNGGSNWNPWFKNLIVHYFGIMECSDYYFLWGYPGDGFRASMFGFPKQALFSADSNWSSWGGGYHPQCHQGNKPECIYAPPNWNRCDQYQFFTDTVQAMCNSLNTNVKQALSNEIKIWPNPAQNNLVLELSNYANQQLKYKIFNSIRKIEKWELMECVNNKITLSVVDLTPGVYSILLYSDDGMLLLSRFVKD